ncbi:hypothetical protein SETIT_3G140200v2 [Setaria italica]|uniref:F-box domain-containing protein n=1 Tax=Setaria italica TaxID=4555 RepID=K3ZC86_SETIT|nr:F-box protein CPR30-like [Setaria italica]RCV16463.1 hypothetical protein SETIT_3G140200v2 [Setaria italica]
MSAPVATPGATTATQDLNDDVLTEILLRLPSEAVLRFRAVCKAWRRITSSPVFLAAHARRRPLELIVQRRGVSGAVLDTIPLLTLDETRRRCLPVKYPEYTGPPEPFWRGYSLIGSCDDLLLFQRGPWIDHYVYSPATRQWTMLARPPGTCMLLCGFYLHGPSGEHRILYFTDDQEGSHYVSSLEVAGARRLGPAVSVVVYSRRIPFFSLDYRGKLHWLRHPWVLFPGDALEVVYADMILAFDTVSETFRRISRPPRRSTNRGVEEFFLLEMDGKLAMAAFLDGSMDLWVLEDYDNDGSWARRFRVRLPPALRHATLAMKLGVEGQNNVILLGDCWNATVGLYHLTKKRLLKKIQFVTADGPRDSLPRTQLNTIVFRDSLKRHAFFDSRGAQ